MILGAKCVLLGKKPGENGWRFPGGFKDRGDMNFETAVWREAGEEVLRPGTDIEKSLTYPKYIGSRNINDWRYRDEIDGVTTMFYETSFIGNPEDVLAGDDLGETAWFDLSLVTPDMMEGEHVHLLKMLLEYV
jgi:bifunctional NMN adenylyltransferase/nudix hydrolase